MRFLPILLSAFLFINCSPKKRENYNPENGVPLKLAQIRKNQVSNVNYNLSFNIPESKEEPIDSKLLLKLFLNNLETPLFLDFKEESDHLKKLTVNGAQIQIIHENEHIKIPLDHLKEGENSLEIDFWAGELSLNRNDEYLYTLLVPDRARTLFPCFDQPNIKAVYKLSITAPKAWRVITAAPQMEEIIKEGFIEHRFGQSDKISTYLFSFVAGKFESADRQIDNFPMNMLYRETDEEKISYSLDSIFQLHENSKVFLQDYTNHPFPFQKLDFAAIPGFQYGGMEHVGAIQYREGSLFLDESATENRKLGRAKLIAHETSHMWFGDLVTMDWFNDVWMKEVFANFMADKIVNPAFPDINHELAFMVGHYPSAYGEDRTKGTNPIRQKLENLNNAGSLYGSIIYNKAPVMMRQLEAVVGKEKFKEGIREYIDTYQNSNADWNNLVQILDRQTEKDLLQWSEVWVNSSGRPIFTDSISYDADGIISHFEIRQKAEDGSDHIWPQTFDVSLVYPDGSQTFSIDMSQSKLDVNEIIGKPKPIAFVYNSNGMGYGVFPTDMTSLQIIDKIKDETTRGSIYINAYENALNGNISPMELIEFYEDRLYLEKNELLSNLLSGYLRYIFWKYLSSDEQLSEQSRITENLWMQLQNNLPPNKKKVLFNTFRSLAYNGESIEHLYDVWSKKMEIPNLRLNKDDYTEIAMDLVLYQHPETDEIIKRAKDAIENPDQQERFNFLLPSLSSDEAVKGNFMASLQLEKNRAKEAWTATALDNINHPLHEKFALKHLRESLDLLDEIQKTGDIFFPKRWLSSTIGNHTSEEAYQIIQDYLKDNPNLNPSLKSKLWQAADDLRRVQLLEKPVKP
ncbi:M1 family metallopeptidase [Maribacter cobaltidurans]|uniref:Aminopeptidase N n=1 Tax=Maribacter cobaltidurans TaxID=1178778 RepID=A0A223V198_9FLAO|nr:M1 family aminopeptidase [Maribacter cobaltidurans]ASV29102.1 peptidase M1 [Maribacter cobaltidurans]GGD71879.1 aminopeptidase N [Maribacter cobaltidurans]